MNRGIVNSIMYEKQAIHFTKTNQVDSAIKYLSLGEWPRPPIKLRCKMYKMCLAHFLDPDDVSILSRLARNFLNVGNCQEALRCAESVLVKANFMKIMIWIKIILCNLQDSKHIEGVVVKAESLFTMCRFEHAFALFSRVCIAKDSIAMNIC